jgi:hypothetical protein
MRHDQYLSGVFLWSLTNLEILWFFVNSSTQLCESAEVGCFLPDKGVWRYLRNTAGNDPSPLTATRDSIMFQK